MKIKLKEVITDFIVPMRDKPKVFNGNVPWCRIEDIEGKYLYRSLSNQNVTNECIKEMNLRVYPLNTLLFTCSASIGITAITKEPVCTNQTFIGLVPSDKIDTEYLYYYLNKIGVDFKKSASITTIPYLPRRFFEDLVIEIPNNLKIQRQIVKVLSDLDAKIELNNRINRELEAMAKTLYDYWFVQFDFPNEQGKPYKSSGGKMVYNAELKREIPLGWEVKKLGKVLSTKLGGTPSTEIKEYWINGEFHWLNSGEIANFPIITSELKITKKAIENSATYLLPKGTIAISITRHIRPSILAVDSCANQSVIGILESEELKSSYLYPLIKNEIPRYLSLRTGAQQPHINKQTIDKTNIIIPANEILKKYYQASNQYYKKIINNAFQNQRLTELRDWLLPMLMNGQVTVKEAEGKSTEIEKPIIKLSELQDQRFELWLKEQGIAARGDIDKKTLRDIFDAMDDEDK